MNAVDEQLLDNITDMNFRDLAAINIRKDGKLLERKITDDVEIVSKEDSEGIDIYVKENAKNAIVLIPVIVSQSGLSDKVYNDFHIGKNANVFIIAGCGINNPEGNDSSHNGIHRFFLEEGSRVKYSEKHYGTGEGKGHKNLDPVTEILLKKGSTMEIDTIQIKGIDNTYRYTEALIHDHATLIINEKIMTHGKQFGKTLFNVTLDGEGSSTHVTSRSVAVSESKQVFESKIYGNNACYAHIECDAIIKDNGNVQATPEITANHVDARLIHEATIGKIAGEQLIKLTSLGVSEEDAEAEIINGFLK